jgi:hypothetical protein
MAYQLTRSGGVATISSAAQSTVGAVHYLWVLLVLQANTTMAVGRCLAAQIQVQDPCLC